MATTRILLVEHHESAIVNVEHRLKQLGHTVCATASSESQAVEKAIETNPQIALVGLSLDGFDCIQLAERIWHLGIPVLFLTDGAESDLLQRAETARPFGYVLAPIEERQLRVTIAVALNLHQGKMRVVERTRQLSRILDHVDAAVMAVDMGGFITFMNPLAESLLERRHAELSGVLLPQVFHVVPEKPLVGGATATAGEEVVFNILQWGARVSGSSATLRTGTDRQTTVNFHAAPLRDAERNCTGAVIVFQPGTKAQELEHELKRTIIRLQSRLRLMESVFESLGDGVAVANRQGRLLLSNQRLREMVGGVSAEGKELAEWPGIYGIFYPDETTPVPFHKLSIVRAMRGEATNEAEVFIRNASLPKGVHVSVSGRPLPDDIDDSIHSAGVIVMRDITERKAAEKSLQEAVEKLSQQSELMQATFNAMSEGVVVADEAGRFTLFNPAAEHLVGMGPTDTGPDQWARQYGIFYSDGGMPVAADDLPLVRAVRGEAIDEMGLFIRNAAKPKGIHLSVSGRPIVVKGAARGGVIVFRDVTDKVRAEEALAQAFDQGRLEILDTVLHNIGNAINSIAVGVGTLQGQLNRNRLLRRFSVFMEAVRAHAGNWEAYIQQDPQGRQVLPFLLAFDDALTKQTQKLLRTVERVNSQTGHIVDIVRTQQDYGNRATQKDVSLRQMVLDALGLLQAGFRRRGIRTHLNFGNAPEEIRVRESQFHQMLVNLFKNAMEATDELRQAGGLKGLPRVELRAYVRREYLVMDVIDNGIGIARKNVRVIFMAGYTTKPEGSGLGLHSAANFVTASGGKIQPLSDGAGQGTTMRVMLPLAALRQARDGDAAAEAVSAQASPA